MLQIMLVAILLFIYFYGTVLRRLTVLRQKINRWPGLGEENNTGREPKWKQRLQIYCDKKPRFHFHLVASGHLQYVQSLHRIVFASKWSIDSAGHPHCLKPHRNVACRHKERSDDVI